MINPSEINLSSLPWLPLDAKSAFPKNPAIYFAIDSQGTVQYIGRSLNPKTRWANHHRYQQLEAIGSIKIVYLFVDSPELLPEIESALILWFAPPLNASRKPANGLNQKRYDGGMKKKIVIKLKEVRQDRNLSQNALARMLGMSLANIQRIEYGKASAIPLDTLISYVKPLSVNLETYWYGYQT